MFRQWREGWRYWLLAHFRAKVPIPNWSSLRRLGNSRTLRSSYFWVAFVPIAAKVLYGMRETFTFHFHGHEYAFIVGLPFSWRIFYFAAVCFGGASFLYSLRCPRIIQDYNTFAEFDMRGKGSRELLQSLRDCVAGAMDVWSSNYSSERRADVLDRMFRRVVSDKTGQTQALGSSGSLDPIPHRTVDLVDVQDAPMAFSWIRDIADWTHYGARVACTVLYAAGFLLLLVILVQNFLFVMSHW